MSASKLIELSKILKFNIASVFSGYETYDANTLKEDSFESEKLEDTLFQEEAALLFSKIKNTVSQKKILI